MDVRTFDAGRARARTAKLRIFFAAAPSAVFFRRTRAQKILGRWPLWWPARHGQNVSFFLLRKLKDSQSYKDFARESAERNTRDPRAMANTNLNQRTVRSYRKTTALTRRVLSARIKRRTSWYSHCDLYLRRFTAFLRAEEFLTI